MQEYWKDGRRLVFVSSVPCGDACLWWPPQTIHNSYANSDELDVMWYYNQDILDEYRLNTTRLFKYVPPLQMHMHQPVANSVSVVSTTQKHNFCRSPCHVHMNMYKTFTSCVSSETSLATSNADWNREQAMRSSTPRLVLCRMSWTLTPHITTLLHGLFAYPSSLADLASRANRLLPDFIDAALAEGRTGFPQILIADEFQDRSYLVLLALRRNRLRPCKYLSLTDSSVLSQVAAL